MKPLKKFPILIAVVLVLTGCGDNAITPTRSGATSGENYELFQRPGGLTDPSAGDGGLSYPYPQIIHQVFTPEGDLYDRKCHVWQITWPDYAQGYDPAKIPTVFSPNGALNSVAYLNSVGAQTTYNSILSLYLDDKIKRSSDMSELIYAVNAPAGSMETVSFNYVYSSPKSVYKMAQESPSDFQFHFQAPYPVDELAYDTGEVLFFKLGDPEDDKLYGAVVVASMTPRIVQVFLAVPNIQAIDAIQINP